MEALLEGGFTIARDLQADKKCVLKHLLRMAMLLDEASDDFYMTQLPMQVLLRLFAALAPIGRLLGYEPLRSEARRGVLTRGGRQMTKVELTIAVHHSGTPKGCRIAQEGRRAI